MLTKEQMNAVVGPDLDFMELKTRLKVPIRDRDVPSVERDSFGNRVAFSQWQTDSQRLELLVQCVFQASLKLVPIWWQNTVY